MSVSAEPRRPAGVQKDVGNTRLRARIALFALALTGFAAIVAVSFRHQLAINASSFEYRWRSTVWGIPIAETTVPSPLSAYARLNSEHLGLTRSVWADVPPGRMQIGLSFVLLDVASAFELDMVTDEDGAKLVAALRDELAAGLPEPLVFGWKYKSNEYVLSRENSGKDLLSVPIRDH